MPEAKNKLNKVQKNTKKALPKKQAGIINVKSDVEGVVCDGGGGALGHPQVWYGFDVHDRISCHYCGRKFVKTKV